MRARNGRTWLPRERGDGPEYAGFSFEMVEAPPRTRGWTRVDAEHIDAVLGSPANAGMDPHSMRP